MKISPADRLDSSGGFSLLEVVFALAVMAIAASFALPNLAALLRRQDSNAAIGLLSSKILQMRGLAYGSAMGIQLREGSPVEQTSHTFSQVAFVVERGFEINASGMCTAGIVEIYEADVRTARCTVAHPDCSLDCTK